MSIATIASTTGPLDSIATTPVDTDGMSTWLAQLCVDTQKIGDIVLRTQVANIIYKDYPRNPEETNFIECRCGEWIHVSDFDEHLDGYPHAGRASGWEVLQYDFDETDDDDDTTDDEDGIFRGGVFHIYSPSRPDLYWEVGAFDMSDRDVEDVLICRQQIFDEFRDDPEYVGPMWEIFNIGDVVIDLLDTFDCPMREAGDNISMWVSMHEHRIRDEMDRLRQIEMHRHQAFRELDLDVLRLALGETSNDEPSA